MLRVLLLTVVCATTLVLPATSAEPVLSRYRDVTLGDTVQVVVERLQMTLSDVKVVSERPNARPATHLADAAVCQWRR